MKEILFKEELSLDDVLHLSEILTYLKENMKSIHILILLEENSLKESYLKISNFLTYLQVNKVKRAYQHLFFGDFEEEKNFLIRKILKMTNEIESLGLGEISTVCGLKFLEEEKGRKYIKDAMLSAKGFFYRTLKELIQENKNKELKDLDPTILFRDGLIKEGDIVVFSKEFALKYQNEINKLIEIFEKKEIKIKKIKFI